MIKLILKLPQNQPLKLAFSGGVDSLAMAHFLRRNKNVTLCHFNHGCEYSNLIEQQCRERAEQLNMPIVVGHIDGERQPKQSLEDYWRRARYRFLYDCNGEIVCTAHHLDDAIETWCMSSFHGESKLIQPEQTINFNNKNNKLLRPFLLTSKQDLINYAERHGLVPVDDPYNREDHLMRNYFRKNVIEHVKYINPGIDKVIRKKYIELQQRTNIIDKQLC